MSVASWTSTESIKRKEDVAELSASPPAMRKDDPSQGVPVFCTFGKGVEEAGGTGNISVVGRSYAEPAAFLWSHCVVLRLAPASTMTIFHSYVSHWLSDGIVVLLAAPLT